MKAGISLSISCGDLIYHRQECMTWVRACITFESCQNLPLLKIVTWVIVAKHVSIFTVILTGLWAFIGATPSYSSRPFLCAFTSRYRLAILQWNMVFVHAHAELQGLAEAIELRLLGPLPLFTWIRLFSPTLHPISDHVIKRVYMWLISACLHVQVVRVCVRIVHTYEYKLVCVERRMKSSMCCIGRNVPSLNCFMLGRVWC